MPPTSAPSSAHAKVATGTADGALRGAAGAPPGTPRAALAASAASSAGDTPAAGAGAGQVPPTAASARQPWPLSATSTSGIWAGLPARSGDRGTSAVHTAPSQRCVQVRGPGASPRVAAVSRMLGVSGTAPAPARAPHPAGR
jgi:hypothetical protein